MNPTYRVLVLRNDRLDTKASYLKAKKYFTEKGIDVSFFTKDVTELTSVHEYLQRKGFDTKTGQPTTISYLGLDDITKDNCRKYVKEGEYDCVVFSWDIDTINHPILSNQVVTSWANNKPLYSGTEFIQLAINKYFVERNEVWTRITHEMMHAFCWGLSRKLGVVNTILDEMDMTHTGIPFYKNDEPYATLGNYDLTFKNIRPHLNMLTNTQNYKYFSKAEVEKWKLKPELWQALDKAREMAGVPISITSGLRSSVKNLLIGGASKSTHLEGLGCDISCTDSGKRYNILKALLDAGFKRIGVYKAHIHADLGGKEYPQPVIWFNEKE